MRTHQHRNAQNEQGTHPSRFRAVLKVCRLHLLSRRTFYDAVAVRSDSGVGVGDGLGTIEHCTLFGGIRLLIQAETICV
jgi:hypothetical protein